MVRKARLQTVTEDFRTYEPETFTDEDGSKIVMRKCEELVDGRWEPFYVVEKKNRRNSRVRKPRVDRKMVK